MDLRTSRVIFPPVVAIATAYLALGGVAGARAPQGHAQGVVISRA
jgi:hypothetical protein